MPLIVSVPWLPEMHGRRSSAFVELVDVMPTLSDLAGLPPAPGGSAPLAGVSFAGTLANGTGGKTFALSQYPRCPVNPRVPWELNWCIEVNSSAFQWMGYSLRTEGWRYTAWLPWDGATLKARFPETRRNGTDAFYDELYQHPMVRAGEGAGLARAGTVPAPPLIFETQPSLRLLMARTERNRDGL